MEPTYFIINSSKDIREVGDLKVIIIGETYDPSHDSYLLASHTRYYGNVIDLGCGSGYITAELIKLGNNVIAIDINPYAVISTKETLIANNLYNERANIIQGDGLKVLRPCKCFNAIFTNPPYLPISEFNSWLGISWSGGCEGVEVFLNMINGADELLKECGEIIFTHSTLSNIGKIVSRLSSLGFNVHEITRKCFFMECIVLFKASRVNQ